MSAQGSLLDDGNIIDVDIAERMEQSFLDYSMSVIVGRALPDVRDGLKPVQRRILHAMNEAGLRADRQHRKCASVVGDVMKKYHPHGDSAIYDALVRMAQDFAIREPLVDGRGNFGSIDGDPAAAFRYTECRLSPLAMEMLADIDEDTVDFVANYDGFEVEPVALPSRLPNLLVNGSTGIAVGMATNIPPHNLVETIDACQLLIRNPDADLDDVMEVLPAPDFPTGARIVPGDGIREAFETGKGAVTMEAIAATETRSGGLPRIVVTEIPYQVNKATLLTKIADLVKERRLDGIRDLRDESSRDGMRIVIELKRGEDPGKTLQKLFKLTDLRTNFNVNFVALDDGRPRTMGVLEALHLYLAHQREVLTRRTSYRLGQARDRLHILQGLLIALDNLDAVIALIRGSDSAAEAREGLIETFGMSDAQAGAVLDMQLRRLARLERDKIQAEHDELLELVTELTAILDDPARLDAVLSSELAEIAETHGNPRRSRLGEEVVVAAHDKAAPATVLAAQDVTTYVTAGGYVKSVGRKRLTSPHNDLRDPIVAVLRGAADDVLLLVDQDGNGYRIDVSQLDVVSMQRRGTAVQAVLGDPPEAPIAGAVVLGDHDHVLTVSAAGLVKRTERAEYEGRLRSMAAAGVRDGDRIVAVLGADEADELLVATSAGQAIRFPVSDVSTMGRRASGVTAIKVPKGGEVVSATLIGEHLDVIVLARDGGAKVVPGGDFPLQGRGGKGVLTGSTALAWAGSGRTLHIPTDGEWITVRPETLTISTRSRTPTAGLPPVTGMPVAEGAADDT